MELTPICFLQKLQECRKEYHKQLQSTRSESDSAHFFNPSLKSFLKKHQEELTLLCGMNFDRSFISFVNTYLLKENSLK